MDSYQNQLRSLLTMIDNLLPIENHIEQKLTSIDYPVNRFINKQLKFSHISFRLIFKNYKH